jgi:glycosyltransferase involved in cell wall biosynthesis
LTYSINSLYQYASALIYPSLYEGFGLPPLEAMANGCPVISSNAGPLPEVNGGAAEYFDPYLSDDLCIAIERVVYDNIRTKELQNLGFDQIKKYSWERCASETVKLYRSLI